MAQKLPEAASGRPYIPRRSDATLPSPAYDLSGVPHFPIRLDQSIPYAISPLLLPSRVAEFVGQRLMAPGIDRTRRLDAHPTFLEPVAVAPNSEVLMETAIAPIVKRHGEATGANSLYVSSSGYPLPFWVQEALGTEIREFDFDEAIKNGERLPDTIRVVYLDHPRTYGASRSTENLRQFIQANPDVLFIVDQANVGFAANHSESEGSAQDLSLFSSLPDSLLITTGSTSKQIATGVAWMYASERVRAYISSQREPLVAGFDEDSLQVAFRVLDQQAATAAYISQIVHNRHEIASRLPEGVLPFGERNLPDIIVDATKLGFSDSAAMVEAFRKGDEKNGIAPMAIKTCEPYADSAKHPEVRNHAYIAIPVDTEVLENLYRALHIG